MSALTLVKVHRGVAAVLAVLALSAGLLVSAMPRAMQAAYDRALRQDLDAASAQAADIVVTRRPQLAEHTLTTPAAFAELDERWQGLLPPALREVTEHGPGSRAHYSAKTEETPVAARIGPGFQAYQFVNVGWLSDAERKVRYVEGAPPGPAGRVRVPARPELGEIPRFDIALTREAAERMDLPVGTMLLLGHSGTIAARVTALFEPVDPADRYWQHNGDLLHVSVRRGGPDHDEFHITGLTSAATLSRLTGEERQLIYRWVLPVRGEDLTARNARDVIEAMAAYSDSVRVADPGAGKGFIAQTGFQADTGLGNLLTGFLGRQRTAETLLALLLGGLTVVALGVILLAVRLAEERTHAALALMRARGGSLARVTATGTAMVALAVVPAAALGYAAAYLVPGPVTALAHAGPALLALAAVAFAAVRLALAHRGPLRERRDDMVAQRPSPRRITLEIVVVGLALGGAYLLRNRGLTTSAEGGADVFLLLVPVGLTVASALVLIRCYPYPLRLVVRLLDRGRRAVPFLGFTLAARARASAALPVLILLPALAVSVFAAVIADGLDAAQRESAWRRAGADAKLESTVTIPQDAIERVRRVPGVRAVVPVAKDVVAIGLGGRPGVGVALDLAEYRKIIAGTPLSAPPPPTAAPAAPKVAALVSPELSNGGEFAITWRNRIDVVPSGIVRGLPGITAETDRLVVVPLAAAGSIAVNTLLIQGTGVDPAALAAAARLPVKPLVATFDGELAEIADAPLAATVSRTLLVVTLALGAYALVAVVLVLAAGGAQRGAALALLRTLGLSERQARGMTVLEVTPMIALTALAGLGLGLALPYALGPGIDLSPYAGGPATGDHPLDLVTPSLLAGGLTAVAVLGVFTHTAVTRRRALGHVLRVGE